MNEAASTMGETQLRHRVLTAAAMAAQALTDTEQPPEARLQTLMEAHGRILAVRGPSSPLTFSRFRDLLAGDLARLLPDGVPAEEMGGVRLITPDGLYDDDLYDLEQEQRLVLRTLAKAVMRGRRADSDGIDAEMDQERAYAAFEEALGPGRLCRGAQGPDPDARRAGREAAEAEVAQQCRRFLPSHQPRRDL
jgi:hypothetical protein